MNKIVFNLFLTSLVLLGGSAKSQNPTSDAEYNLLCKKMVKTVIFPREISETCKSSMVSLVVSFDDRNMLRNIAYSSNFPEALIMEIRKNVDIFMEIKWDKIFPELKGKTGYSILIPLVYYFDVDCSEQITSLEFSKIIEQGLTLENSSSGDTKMVKPVVIKLTKPRP